MTAMEEKVILGMRLLQACRNELLSLYPFLDGAFATLPYRASGDTETAGTEGLHLLFSPSIS